VLVIGMDPGAINTGVAWVLGEKSPISASVETLTCTNQFPSRYVLFREKLERFLSSVPEDPSAIAVEEPISDFPRGIPAEEQRSVIHMNGVYAVMVAEATRMWPRAQLFSWTPRLWRKVGEDKKIVIARMARKYNVRFTSDDESDALGVADHAWLLMSQRRGGSAETFLSQTQKP
jgi:Holliday junction resolvasome RuvABC endonuclease subunit